MVDNQQVLLSLRMVAAAAAKLANDYERVVPCTIVFDEPKKRAKK